MDLTPEQSERVRYLAEDEWGRGSEDEAAQWAEFDRVLAQMSAAELHAFVDQMNWDGGGADRLNRVLAHPLCDRGTALMIYWLARPTFYLAYQTRDRVRDEVGWALEEFDMLREIERRFADGTFASADIAFNPADDRGLDHTRKHPRIRPVPVYGVENGRRVQLNKNEPLGPAVDPRAVLRGDVRSGPRPRGRHITTRCSGPAGMVTCNSQAG
jgi:hypothetical protein